MAVNQEVLNFAAKILNHVSRAEQKVYQADGVFNAGKFCAYENVHQMITEELGRADKKTSHDCSRN